MGLIETVTEDIVRSIAGKIKAGSSSYIGGSGGGGGGSTIASVPPISGNGGGIAGTAIPGFSAPTVPQVSATGQYVSRTAGQAGEAVVRNIASLPPINQAINFQLATSQARAMGTAPTIAGVQALQTQMAARGTALSPADIATTLQQAGLVGMGGRNIGAFTRSASDISNLMPGLGVAGSGSAYMSMMNPNTVAMLRPFGINLRNAQTGRAADINSIINQIWSMLNNLKSKSGPITATDINASLMPGGFLDNFISSYGGDSNMQQAIIQALYAKASGATDLSKASMVRAGITTPAISAQAKRTGAETARAQITAEDLATGFGAAQLALSKFTEFINGFLDNPNVKKFLTGKSFLENVFRADGGPTESNKPFIIGERGPEVFVPKTDGYIVPNHFLPDNMRRITYAANGAVAGAAGKIPSKDPGNDDGRADSLYTYLRSMGLSHNGAAGVIGNIAKESTFRPGAVGDSGKAYGIAQWHKPGQDRLREWAKSRGLNPGDFNTQAMFLVDELQDYKGMWRKLKSNNISVEDAAGLMMRHYERPADQSDKAAQARARAGVSYVGGSVVDAVSGGASLAASAAAAVAASVSENATATAGPMNIFNRMGQYMDALKRLGNFGDNSGASSVYEQAFLPKRASGGHGAKNSQYLVGEQGPEVFVPYGASGSRGGPVSYGGVVIKVEGKAFDEETLAKELRRLLQSDEIEKAARTR